VFRFLHSSLELTNIDTDENPDPKGAQDNHLARIRWKLRNGWWNAQEQRGLRLLISSRCIAQSCYRRETPQDANGWNSVSKRELAR
jgi:hypothetical protein